MLKTTTNITTPSFSLAAYQKGSLTAEKLALVLPGKLDTKDYPHMRKLVDVLASKGYLALSFDPPGTWESEGDVSHYTITNYLKAVEEIIILYGSKPTLLVGHSNGGSIAMISGAKIKAVEKIISVMSKNTFKKNLDVKWEQEGFHVSSRDTPLEYEKRERFFNLPFTFYEDSQKYDVSDALKSCTKPKLFIAGSKDELVSVEAIKEIVAMTAEPKKLVIIDSIHGYRKDEKIIQEVNDLIEKFITE